MEWRDYTVSVICQHGTYSLSDEEQTQDQGSLKRTDYFIYSLSVVPESGWRAARFTVQSSGTKCYVGTNTRTFTDNSWSGSTYSDTHMSWCQYSQDEYGHANIVITIEFEQYTPTDDSAINLTLVSNPSGIGVLTGGGLKSGSVGALGTYTVDATVVIAHQGKYKFDYWIDDAGIKHNEKSFSKEFVFKSGYTVQSPEQKTFTAYFREIGFILRSASSGIILRDASGSILRDT